MDLKSIQALGEKTNRIIEIEQVLTQIHQLADKSVSEDYSAISVSICDQKLKVEFVKKPEKRIQLKMDKQEERLPDGLFIMGHGFARLGYGDNVINLEGRFQAMIFEALLHSLKEEQLELNKQIRSQSDKL